MSQKEGHGSETDSVKSTDLMIPLISTDSSNLLDSLSPQSRRRFIHVKTKSESDSSDLEKVNDTHTIFKSLVDEKRKTSSDESDLQSRNSSFNEGQRVDLDSRANIRYMDDDDLVNVDNYSLFERRPEQVWTHSQAEASTSRQSSGPSELIEIKIEKDECEDSEVSKEATETELKSVEVEKP